MSGKVILVATEVDPGLRLPLDPDHRPSVPEHEGSVLKDGVFLETSEVKSTEPREDSGRRVSGQRTTGEEGPSQLNPLVINVMTGSSGTVGPTPTLRVTRHLTVVPATATVASVPQGEVAGGHPRREPLRSSRGYLVDRTTTRVRRNSGRRLPVKRRGSEVTR